MVKACLPRILLLSVLAWLVLAATASAAAAGGEKGAWARWADGGDLRLPAEPHRRRGGHGMVVDLLGKRAQPPTASTDINKPERLEDRVVLAVPTPAALFGGAPLEARQILGNPVEAINSASRSADQAIAAASQSAREAVQQANDQVRQAQDRQRQAEDQARQANDAATRASISANNAVVQAQASARAGIADAQNAARESARTQISDNLAMVTSSASAQLASQVASIQASASASAATGIALASASAATAIAAATQSASAAVQSAQQQAQQQIQAARDDANLRVSQAQGTAVSVTQAALAVVGAIIGSSLFTILGFYIFTRYRRGKRKDQTAQALRREISYPKQETLVTTNSMVMRDDYPRDIKAPISPQRPETARTTGSNGMGYAVSTFSDGTPNFSRSTTFVNNGIPQMGMQREGSITRRPVAPSPRKQTFSLFPPAPRSRDGPPTGPLPPTPTTARDPASASAPAPPAPTTTAVAVDAAPTNEKLYRVDEEDGELVEGSKDWLRRTQTVSPFGDLADTPTDEKDPNWPFARPNSPPPAAK